MAWCGASGSAVIRSIIRTKQAPIASICSRQNSVASYSRMIRICGRVGLRKKVTLSRKLLNEKSRSSSSRIAIACSFSSASTEWKWRKVKAASNRRCRPHCCCKAASG